jgi:hypothetical protein
MMGGLPLPSSCPKDPIMAITKTAKRMVTIYTHGGFGGSTEVGALLSIEDSSSGKGRFVRYTPKGKRKPDYKSADSLVVLDGDHHPVPWKGLDDQGDGCSRTRWGCFDRRYADHYNIEVNAIIAAGATVLIDRRDDAARLVTEVRKVD